MNNAYKPFASLIANLKEIKALYAKSDVLKEEIINLVSPYAVGEITTVQGYSHSGKPCRVTEVALTTHNDRLDILVRAKVLKADGSDSLSSVSWTKSHDKKLETVLMDLLQSIK